MKELTISECRNFVQENEKRYLDLLDEVNSFIRLIKNIDSQKCIYRSYSRKDNKNEDSEFKRPSKILEKLIKWRALYSGNSNINDLHDVIGVTIVVYYHSDIPYIYDLIEKKASIKNLHLVKYMNGGNYREYKKLGYHARHLVLMSSNLALVDIKCEMQIKTLLPTRGGARRARGDRRSAPL
jgi:ppGpp synthetase/RelA/SpoT-type nucleotidyltranferase